MFDSTPHKFDRPPGRNEILHEVALRKIQKRRDDYAQGRMLDLIALWNDETHLLRQAVEDETDWGPFELAEITPAFYDAFGARRVLCRFIFHIAPKDRAHFEKILMERLSRITEWKQAPRLAPAPTD